MRRTAFALALAVGAALMSAPAAGAASNGRPADEAIARLQSQGNRVVVNKVGTGPLADCTVTSMRPQQVRELPRGGTVFGVPFVPTITVVHVGVLC